MTDRPAFAQDVILSATMLLTPFVLAGRPPTRSDIDTLIESPVVPSEEARRALRQYFDWAFGIADVVRWVDVDGMPRN